MQSSLVIPLEIIYLIIDFVDKPCDLSRLSLTSKSLHHFITVNNLQYLRNLRCELYQPRIWSLFQRDTHVSSQIRQLDLFSHFQYQEHLTPPLCRALVTDDAGWEESVPIFKQAFMNMVNLTKLSWHNNEAALEKILDLCLYVVLCRKDVQELFVSFPETILVMSPSLHQNQISKVVMDHLTKIDIIFATNAQFENKGSTVETLIKLMVDCCPNLEELRLIAHRHDSFSLPTSRIFVDGHWTNLRRLILHERNFNLPEAPDLAAESAILNNFWARHPNIEYLRLRANQCYKIDIQSGLLPKLKSLSGFLGPNYSAVAIDVLARIEHMCDINTMYPCPRFPTSYFKHTTSLTSLAIMVLDEDWKRLLFNHPTITRLALRRSLKFHFQEGYLYTVFKEVYVPSVFKMLSSLPRLTHLFLYDTQLNARSEWRSILSQFPKLEYIRGLGPFWNVLERDPEGKVTGWHLADETLSESLERFEDWGCNLSV